MIILTLVMIFCASIVMAEGPSWIGAFFVKGKVGLKWQKFDGTTQYRIMRKIDTDANFSELGATDKTHYFDSELVPGAIYLYKIIAVTANGEMESTEKSITIPGSAVGKFEAPEWVGLRIDRNKIFLNWEGIKGAIAYNIYRSETSGSGYEVVGNTPATKYADNQDIKKGTTYYYVLSALNEEFEETEKSLEMSIKYGVSADEIKRQEAEAAAMKLVDLPITYLYDIKDAGQNGSLLQPADIYINSKGNIYISDALNARICVYDPDGNFLFQFGEKANKSEIDNPVPGTMLYPMTLFIDKEDNVYITDTFLHNIQKYTADGKFISSITIEGEERAKFRPGGLAVLDDGRVIVTDAGNHRYYVFDKDGKVLIKKGKKGSKPGEFVSPDEITLTPDGKVLLVDVMNCRIQELEVDGTPIRQFGSIGQTAGTFARPKGITLDEQGNIWISDAMTSAVQVWTREGEVKSAIGQFEDVSLTFQGPRGMFIKDSKFYIVSRLNSRVMVFKIGN